MMNRSVIRDAAMFAGLAVTFISVSTRAQAQQGIFSKWSRIPSIIEMKGVDSSKGDRVLLKARCGAADSNSAPPLDTPIMRQLDLNGTTVQRCRSSPV